MKLINYFTVVGNRNIITTLLFYERVYDDNHAIQGCVDRVGIRVNAVHKKNRIDPRLHRQIKQP